MADLLRYGAYVPRYRAPLPELQSFLARPGRPRAQALATPGLDEDSLTMAFEAAREALGAEAPPRALLSLTLSPPVSLRKLSATLVRALGLPEDTTPYDLAGHPGSLLDGLEVAAGMAERDAGRSVLVVVSDHQVASDERALDLLPAGGAAAFLVGATGGFCRLGPLVRAGQEVYDVWRLGLEPEPRYRLEVLADAYGWAAGATFTALERLTERPAGAYAAVCPSQPHPQAVRGLARAGVGDEQLERTSFVARIGNLGAASVGVALALGLDEAEPGQELLAFGYGAGEGVAQALSVTAPPPALGLAGRLEGEPITLGTYYRWTRGRHPEPH